MLPRRIEMIGDKGAPFAHVIGTRRQHEVIERELAATLEQIRKRAFSLGCYEHVRLIDFDPGQPATFGTKCIELVGYGFLLEEERLAGGKPFLPRYDFGRGQIAGCHDWLSFNCWTWFAPSPLPTRLRASDCHAAPD